MEFIYGYICKKTFEYFIFIYFSNHFFNGMVSFLNSNFVASIISGLVAFGVAKFQINVERKREDKRIERKIQKQKKDDITHLLIILKEFQCEEENVANVVGLSNKNLAMINYQKFLESRENLKNERIVCRDYFVETKEVQENFKKIFNLSREQATNYYQAYVNGGDTADVAQNKIRKGKWADEIKCACESVESKLKGN